MKGFGIYKLIEEAGELLQAVGKAGAFPEGDHPDGGPPLRQRVEEEAGDAIAALSYFIAANGLDRDKVFARAARKLDQFHAWGLTGYRGDSPPPRPGFTSE